MTLTSTIFLIFLLAFLGSFIQRVSGFGFGVFVMMFLPFIIPTLGEAATVSGLLAMTASLIVAIKHWKHIQWKSMLLLLLTNAIVSFISIHFMAGMANENLENLLGIILIVLAIYSLANQWYKETKTTPASEKAEPLKHQNLFQILAGAIGGITGGMFGMPGPPIVIYCIEAIHSKEAYVATIQAIFFGSNVFYTIFRAKAGFFTENTASYWLFGLVGLILGTILGARLFDKISGPHLRKLVYILMLVSGIVTLF